MQKAREQPEAAGLAKAAANLGQKQRAPIQEIEPPQKGKCQFCNQGNIITLHPCSRCTKRGHKTCMTADICPSCTVATKPVDAAELGSALHRYLQNGTMKGISRSGPPSTVPTPSGTPATSGRNTPEKVTAENIVTVEDHDSDKEEFQFPVVQGGNMGSLV